MLSAYPVQNEEFQAELKIENGEAVEEATEEATISQENA